MPNPVPVAQAQQVNPFQSLLSSPYAISQGLTQISPTNPAAAEIQKILSNPGLASDSGANLAALFHQAKQWEDSAAAQQAQDKATTPPQTDPRLTAIGDQEVADATTFKNNIPQLAFTLTQQAAEAQKSILASAIDSNNQSYNSRGLLFSAARSGANASAVGQSANQITQDASAINRGLQSTSDQLSNNALNTQATIAGSQQQLASQSDTYKNDYLNLALKNQQAQSKAIGDVASGLGSGAGYLLGGLTANGGNNNTTTNSSSNGLGYGNAGFQSSANLNLPALPSLTGTSN